MKSIEEKAKAYDGAIEKLRRLHDDYDTVSTLIDIKEELEHIFPELKESEDEKIRKAQLDYWRSVGGKEWYGIPVQETIAWLERQCECHISHDDEIMIEQLTEYFNTGRGLQNTFETVVAWLNDVKRKLEKQGEQINSDIDNKFIRMRETKPKDISEFLDRLTTVEQEFLWEHIAKIRELDKEEQKSANKIEPIFNVGDKIQYSKGCGTIMTIEKIENGEYIFADNMGHTTIESGNKWYFVDQKSAWSEEDEKCIRLSTDIIDSALRAGFCVQLDRDRCVDWLKSLRPQNTWKPSDEQMNAFDAILVYNPPCSNECRNHLITLYNELKKLKEE